MSREPDPDGPDELHEIRSLASETRSRLARRAGRATQEVAGDPQASASTSWGAVAMPAPARVVAVAAPPVGDVRRRSRWVRPIAVVGLGVAVAVGAMVVRSMQAPDRRPLVKVELARPTAAPPASTSAAGAGDAVVAERAPAPTPPPPKPASIARPKPPAVPDAPVVDEPPPPAEPPPPPAEPSLDQLLQEAGVPAPAPSRPKLARSELSAVDIKRGMSAVETRAKACFAGAQGMAQLQLSVAPTGHVERVSLSGPFAATPVGACIERAVNAAAFPAWDGAPQSFRYNFLLAD